MQSDLAQTLAELSAKATQGEWGIWREPISSRHDAIAELTEQVAATKSISDALVLLDAGGLCPASTGCGPTSDANATFITSLVNAYRTGKLVVVDDGAVERMAATMWIAEAQRAAPNVAKMRTLAGFGYESKKVRENWTGLATAALAALKGADHAG